MDDHLTETKSSGGITSLLKNSKDWQSILIIMFTVAFFFRDILLRNSFLWEDFIYQYYPFRNFAAAAMSRGELPLWNPYTFCGMPFQADIQTAIFYIPNLLLTYFVHGNQLDFYWVEVLIIIHVMLAGIFMYYLAKHFGMQRMVALFTGLTFAFSGFMVTHVIHQTFICQIAWMPLILLLTRKAVLQRSILFMILAGAVIGHAMLAGSPQFTLYIFFFLFVFILFESFFAYRQSGFKNAMVTLALAAGVFVIAAGIAGVQILPTFELAGLSQRSEMAFENSSESSLSWVQLFTVIVPKYFGESNANGTTFVLPESYWLYWETCSYLGIIGLIGVTFSFSLVRTNRVVAFLCCMMIFSLLYALGNNFVLHSFFYNVIPGFDKFRVPGRMLFLFTFSAVLLSGFGLQQILERVQSFSRLRNILLSVLVVGVLIWIVSASGLTARLQNVVLDGNASSMAMRETIKALVVVSLFAIALLLQHIFRWPAVALLILLTVIQFADLYEFGFAYNNGTVNPYEYYSKRKDLVNLLQKEGETELLRINARFEGARLLDRNQGMIDDVFMMEGYTPLALKRIYPPGKTWEDVCDLMNAKYRTRVDTQHRTMGYIKAPTYGPRALIVYDTKVLKDEGTIKTFMESDAFNFRRTVVLEDEPLDAISDTLYDPGWSVRITSYKLNAMSLNVSTPKKSFLILSEIYYPGWNAYVDGTPKRVYRADWSLRAIPLHAGTQTVEVRFEPASFRFGAWISLATIGVCLGGIGYGALKKFRLDGGSTRSSNTSASIIERHLKY